MTRFGLRSAGGVTPVRMNYDPESPKKLQKELEDLVTNNFQGPGYVLADGRKIGSPKKPRSRNNSNSSKKVSSPRKLASPKKLSSPKKAFSPKKLPSPKKLSSPKKPTSPKKPVSPKSPRKAPSPRKSLTKRPTINSQVTEPRWIPKVPTSKVDTKDEPPALDIYGEQYMKPDCNQRLQQCIIFLSDEGPESCQDFNHKLKKLEHEIGQEWPKLKRAGHKEYQYKPELHRKVVAMMNVQRARVESGARRWFEDTMFPSYEPWAPEKDYEYPPPALERPLFDGADDKPDVLKHVVRPKPDARPREMTGEEKRYAEDPWYEEMPRPEVWHRKMPARFPFGETPFMEKEMSKQISHDLGEDKVSPRMWLANLFTKTTNLFMARPIASALSVWALPEVSDEDVKKLSLRMSLAQQTATAKKSATQTEHQDYYKTTNATQQGKKRKTQAGRARSPKKRVRMQEPSDGDDSDEGDYHMSGANGY